MSNLKTGKTNKWPQGLQQSYREKGDEKGAPRLKTTQNVLKEGKMQAQTLGMYTRGINYKGTQGSVRQVVKITHWL